MLNFFKKNKKLFLGVVIAICFISVGIYLCLDNPETDDVPDSESFSEIDEENNKPNDVETEENIDVDSDDTDTETETEVDIETENIEDTETSDLNLPPAMDEVFSYLWLDSDDGYNDDGLPYLLYEGCKNTAEVVDTIEKYIDKMKDYGYSLTSSKVLVDTFYVYYLESSDNSLEQFAYRDEVCHMAIQGFTDDKYDWHSIYVYYSPSIVTEYREVDGMASDDSSGSSDSDSNFGSNNSESGVKVKCTKCHGDKEITCTNCDGWGYKESYTSTPNYSGSTSGSHSGVTKEKCYKCRGTGEITCTRCHGSGVQ